MPARGAGLPLWGPRAQIFVVVTFLLPVLTDSAMTTGRDNRIHQRLAARQVWKYSPWDKLCPPGTHVSEDGKTCLNCTSGVDYTLHWNKLFSCLLCTTCKSGKEERVPCTRTKNTQCQCKPGTFQGEYSPEFCQQCSTGCPVGMVKAEPCTPWSDLKCVKQEAGSSQLVTEIALGAIAVLLLLLLPPLTAWTCFYCTRHGRGLGPERVSTCLCPPRKPRALGSGRREVVSDRDSLSMLASEQELEHQEHAELAGAIVLSPAEEAEHLLGPAGAEGSHVRRRRLVPAHGADPIESLRLYFDYFASIVPFGSWDKLMRQMGLEDNDICVARARASDPREALYEMLVTWLSKVGKAASVNTLLDALETLRERNAMESIQNHLVGSGTYRYDEDGADPGVS